MIFLSQALDLILQNRPDYGIVTVNLADALGTRCAQDIRANLTMPPFNVSAMDGYAVKAQDAIEGAKLNVIGQAPAGSAFDGHVGQGQAVRIFTGGIIPQGSDTIVIQENVTRNGDIIQIDTEPCFENAVRKAGIDFRHGDILIPKGTYITPAHILLAASGNHATLPVYCRPKVAIIANGDELAAPGSVLKDGQIISSNSAGLAALITSWGAQAIDMGIAPDNLDSIGALITQAKDADIIVPIGGASVGDYDYMKRAFEAAGYTSIFSKIAVKPGKPTWFGTLGHQAVLGLPGNPASANVCAHLCLKVLLGLCDELRFTQVISSGDIAKNGPRETFLRGRLYLRQNGQIQDGKIHADIFPRQDSSLITPLAAANALIRLPAHGGPWQKGDKIDALPLGQGPDIFRSDFLGSNIFEPDISKT